VTTTSSQPFLQRVRASGLVQTAELSAFLTKLRSRAALTEAQLLEEFVQAGLLTPFQIRQLLDGKVKRLLFGGKYKLLQPLGTGGMGAVYLAEHARMQRLVALKMLPPEETRKSAVLERFEREARAAVSLDHPNIARAFDIDQDGDIHFLVMEFIDGLTLQQLVSQVGPLPVPVAAEYVAQAATGLHHAHLAGWVHRDIKPGNLMIDRTGMVKLLDFGLARGVQLRGGAVTERIGDTAIMGTADYCAPEQTLNSQAVDIRTDLYALGGTLFYLLTGRPPFAGETLPQKMIAHQFNPPPVVSEIRADVPAALTALIVKLMAKQPDERWTTPADVVAALQPLRPDARPLPPAQVFPVWCPAIQKSIQTPTPNREAQLAGLAPAPLRPARVGTWARSLGLPIAVGLLGAGLLTVAGVGLWSVVQPRPTSTEREPIPPPLPGTILSPSEAERYVEQKYDITVRFEVAGVSGDNKVYLHNRPDRNSSTFVLLIHDKSKIKESRFGTAQAMRDYYKGRTVQVTGRLRIYNDPDHRGGPMFNIPLFSIDQIQEP
jgi:serine/threonine protein kinase